MGSVHRPGGQLNLATAAPHAVADAGRDLGLEPAAVLEAVALVLARQFDIDPVRLGSLARPPEVSVRAAEIAEAFARVISPHPDPGGEASPDPAEAPDRLGAIHQALVVAEHRRTRGVHYTPARVADEVAGLALDQWRRRELPETPVVCDPACGGGAFLLAAARALHGRGIGVADVVGALRGIEIDPLAARVADASVRLWAAVSEPGGGIGPGPQIRVADALLLEHWSTDGAAPDLVVGNPPFGGQLARRTARRRDEGRRARAQLGRSAGYADTASLFLARAIDEVRPHGVVALLQPLSFLGSRDAGAVREAVGTGRLASVWVPTAPVFAASVAVCAPIARAGGVSEGASRRGNVAVVTEQRRITVPRRRLVDHGTWSALWAGAAGVPPVDLDAGSTVGEWCTATSGFRDEFYALAPLVRDDPDPEPTGPPAPGEARVLTSGLVDPAATSWGRRVARLAGHQFDAPVVTIADAASSPERRLAAVAVARSRPKVVVATQTRVVEAVVDDDGRYWPSVPLLSVLLRPEVDDDEHRWSIAAALMAPPVLAWVLARVGGAARSPDAVKLSTRHVLAVPLPVDRGAWSEGAAVLRAGAAGGEPDAAAAALAAAAPALTAAYGLSGVQATSVLGWWRDRLPGGIPEAHR